MRIGGESADQTEGSRGDIRSSTLAKIYNRHPSEEREDAL